MGEALVDQNQLEQIGTYVKTHIGQWIREQNIIPPQQSGLDKEILERIVTVEQQLKFQNEKLELMMGMSDKRFESMNKRFEVVDKRFEDMQLYMDKRFEQVDKRFEQVDKRFEQVDKRFEQVETRFNHMFWSLSIGFTAIVVLMSIYNFVV